MASTGSFFYKGSQEVFDSITYQFKLEPSSLTSLANAFLDEFRMGLSGYGHPMAMIPSFVTGVPDGTETGKFLALDLGGTNLRVCEVTLDGKKSFHLRQQKYKVSEALKTGEAKALFDYLADSVDAFLTSTYASDPSAETPDVLHLGLTFSFPVEQTALDSGKILTWTKGFSAKNAVGNDVVKLLQDAFDRKHMHVKCVALVNDTVGALLSRAYTGGGCMLGAIFGTGTNGAYLEDVAKITKLANSPAAAKGGSMIVNCEWGAFNNSRSHLPFTPFDNIVDRQSINPGFQAFEKLISGMYLGEVTRNILLSLIDASPEPLLFKGKTTKVLNTQYGLDTSVTSDVEAAFIGDTPQAEFEKVYGTKQGFQVDKDSEERLKRVKAVIVKQIGLKEEDVSLQDAYIVRWASELVAQRAAALSGVATAAVLLQTGRASFPGSDGKFPAKNAVEEDTINVGVDGSLIEFYPHYEENLRKSLKALVGERIEKKVVIGLAKDGSGVGAALCALQAVKTSKS